MAQIITVCQNKGGVGKTTIVSNLAYLFAEKGNKVLLIDTDSQGNLTQFFDLQKSTITLQDFFSINTLLPVYTDNPNINIIPNNIKFDRWKAQSINIRNSHYFLRNYLEYLYANDNPNNDLEKYDYILIDTPPSLDISFELAILASDFYIIAMDFGIWALEGLENILGRIEEIKADDITKKCRAKNLGIVLNQFDNTNLSKGLYSAIIDNYDIFSTVINKTIAIKEAQSMKKTIFEYANNNKVSNDFRELFKELEGKLNE